MPLVHGKSEKAFKENVKNEYKAGHPLKQSLAIAYATKRKAQHKAHGGFMEEEKASGYEPCTRCAKGACIEHGTGMAGGGYVEEEKSSGYGMEPEYQARYNRESEMEDDRDMNEDYGFEDDPEEDIVSMIMRDRSQHAAYGGKMRRMSEGGRVANKDHGEMDDELADFHQNEFDDLPLNDDLHADYVGSESDGDEQEDEDRHDVVSQIMKSRRMGAGRMAVPGYGTTYGKYK